MTADEAQSGPSRNAGLTIGILARGAVLALVFLTLGIPVTGLWRFLLLTVAVMALSFGSVRVEGRRWLIAIAAALAVFAVNFVLPGPQIEEGDNVYIPVGASLDVYEAELPPDAQRQMKQIFDDTYINNPKNLPGSPDWWQQEDFKRKPSLFVDHAFSPSSDALWQRPKYSRTVDAVDFNSQEEARIGAINLRAYNFFQPSTKKGRQAALGFANTARIDRDAMPFFVMVELNSALLGGEICWRGQALFEGDGGKFSLVDHAHRACRTITEQDIGKRVFALAIARDKPLSFAVYPDLQHRLAVWARNAVRAIATLVVLIALVRIDGVGQILLPLGAVTSTLLITLIMAPEVLTGFPTHMGGNDGLVHESFGFDISQALHSGRYGEALRGGEKIFYFMPGMRYLKALEDMLFGDTNFGVLLCTMFVPIFLYFILRRLFPLRWSVSLILIFLFTPLFERLGFAQYLYVKEMIKGFPEPLGYGAFLGALALIAWSVPMPDAAPVRSPMPGILIGLALAMSVALRPNLAIAAALLLAMLGVWLLRERRFTEIIALGLGFSPTLLIAWHNWYFGGQFVPLTSAAFVPATLLTPPSTYFAALGDVLRLDFSGDAMRHVLRQLWNWNHVADFYRLIPLLTVFWVLFSRRYTIPLKGLAAVALSLQVLLFFYVPGGRYAYLAWLLVFLVFLAAFRQSFLPWLTRSYPESMQRLGRLPVVRGVREALASSRWSHAQELNQVTARMGFVARLKTVCRPLVSPLGQVLLLLPRDSRLFDIGCGSGGLLHLALNDAGVSSAAGYDVSTKAVAAAKTLPWSSEQLRIMQRAPEEGVPDISGADYVTLCDVLHHIPTQAKVPFLKDIVGQMRPGAALIVADIDAGRRAGSWMNQLHDLIVSQEWVAPVPATVARTMLEQEGLIVREQSFVRSLWYPHYLILAEKPSLAGATQV